MLDEELPLTDDMKLVFGVVSSWLLEEIELIEVYYYYYATESTAFYVLSETCNLKDWAKFKLALALTCSTSTKYWLILTGVFALYYSSIKQCI